VQVPHQSDGVVGSHGSYRRGPVGKRTVTDRPWVAALAWMGLACCLTRGDLDGFTAGSRGRTTCWWLRPRWRSGAWMLRSTLG